MMQQGIQALPTARAPGQAPGQAPTPGMGTNMPSVASMFNMPKAGAAPGIDTSSAVGRSALMPQIMALVAQGPQGVPALQQLMVSPPPPLTSSWQVLSLVSDAQKDLAARKAAGRVAVEAQNAANAGGTVKDQLMAHIAQENQPAAPTQEEPTTYAAHGGEMRVQHFADGADETGVQADPVIAEILRKGPYERTPEDNAKLRAAGYTLQRRKLGITPEAKADLESIGNALVAPFGMAADAAKWLVGVPGSSRRSDTAASVPSTAPASAAPRAAPMYIPTTPTGGIATPSSDFRAAPPDNRGVAGAGGAAPAASGGYGDIQKELKALQNKIPTGLLPEELETKAAELAAKETERQRLAAREKEPVTPELLAARKGLADLATRRQTAQDQRIADYNKRAEDAFQAELARSRQGLLDWDYGRLGTLASFLSGANPKGSFGANLGKGLAAVGTAEQQRMDAARKEYEERQTTARAMEDARDQITQLELQRQEAVAKNDMEAVRGIQDKIDAIQASIASIKGKYATAARTAQTAGIQSLADVLGKRGTLQTQADQARKIEAEIPLYGAHAKYYEAAAKAAMEKPASSGDKQQLAELKALQQDLEKQRESAYGPARTRIEFDLAKVNREIAKMSGIELGGPPMYATNPQTKERIMSTDGGKTWTKAQ